MASAAKFQASRTDRRATPKAPSAARETPLEQVGSFVEFFVWLLILKAFFIPLFVIPTGSMAETLMGANGVHTCPNCGREYPVGFGRSPDRPPEDPQSVQCPNCRWREKFSDVRGRLRDTSGDRIALHGWNFDFGGFLGPRAWDVVVFRNPNEPEVNYIKRLIGLPGQKIEIIDGDVFVNDRIALKPRHVQEQLWHRYYDHDCIPAAKNRDGYFPHWQPLADDNGWRDVGTRQPRFDGVGKDRGAIRFVTRADDRQTCEVTDIYGYNWPEHRDFRPPSLVSDIRVSCDVRIEDGPGFFELSTNKHADRFFARLYADGRVTLEHQTASGDRSTWGERKFPSRSAPRRFALAVADFVAGVELDGERILESTTEQYAVTPGRAKELRRHPQNLDVEMAGDHIRASTARLLIERDNYYTGPTDSPADQHRPWTASDGKPLQLGPDEYFVMGDNSPESFDARLWDTMPLHLGDDYKLGTVPASQMLGRAFFVYLPGCLPLWSGNALAGEDWESGPCWLPNIGKLRWIH